jgi:hypothetical protein
LAQKKHQNLFLSLIPLVPAEVGIDAMMRTLQYLFWISAYAGMSGAGSSQ